MVNRNMSCYYAVYDQSTGQFNAWLAGVLLGFSTNSEISELSEPLVVHYPIAVVEDLADGHVLAVPVDRIRFQPPPKKDRMGDTLEGLRTQRDIAITHLAAWCVAVDDWDGDRTYWDEFFKEAIGAREKALPRIRHLLKDAIDKIRQTGTSK